MMKQVAPLRYGVIFKKAFSQPDIFTAFVKDILGIEFGCDTVETEKSFVQTIGNVRVEFDLYAEDKKNRVIVEIQHDNNADHYDRFLHCHCVALLEQAENYKNYRPDLTVYTIVVLTSGDNHKTDVAVIDFDPKDKYGKGLNEIHHKVIYLATKYVNESTPEPYQAWLKMINESLTENIEESHYPRPEMQKTIALIAKNLVTPEERYWMIEEYNAQAREKKEFEEGEKTGIEKNKREVAKSMLAEKLPLELIVKLTGLTTVEIENLNNEAFADE